MIHLWNPDRHRRIGIGILAVDPRPRPLLHCCRSLIALRRSTSDLRSGGTATLPSPATVWAWRRGERHVVAVQLAEQAAMLHDITGTIVVAIDATPVGETVPGRLRLGGFEAAIVAAG